MAYVGISQKLMNDVHGKIRTMENVEDQNNIKMFVGNDSDTPVLTGEDWAWLERVMWKDKLHLKEQMPNEWMGKINFVDLHFTRIYANGHTGQTSYRFRVDPEMTVPPKTGTYAPDIPSKECDALPPTSRAKQFVESSIAIDKKFKEVQEKVNNFLNSCKSLNEAVKLWPGVMLYIPKEYLDKLEEKKAKQSRGPSIDALKALEEMNADELTALAATHRIGAA